MTVAEGYEALSLRWNLGWSILSASSPYLPYPQILSNPREISSDLQSTLRKLNAFTLKDGKFQPGYEPCSDTWEKKGGKTQIETL